MIILLVLCLPVLLYLYMKSKYNYWINRDFQQLTPSIPFGNIPNPWNRKDTFGLTVRNLYNEMKEKNWKHGGAYFMWNPIYLVTDLELVKNVMTKDFQYFTDRGFYYNEKDDPLSAHLFTIEGTKWRNLRTQLTPTFTSGKMKMMFQTLVDCEEQLLKQVEENAISKQPIDIKEVLGCFTTDIIGSCAFGLDLKTFQQEKSPFREYGKKVFTMSKLRGLKIAFSNNLPGLSRKLGVTVIPKDVSSFFLKMVDDTVSYREKNNVRRNDFMQLLIDIKNNKLSEDGYKHDGKTLTMDELSAQCFVFFLAGFETSSTAMTFALYELSKNQDIQENVREEINSVLKKHDGKITYEALQDMKYMNQVINETLRKYPPVPFVTRKSIQDYKVPNEKLVIEKGTRVLIPIYGIHYDAEYYPNPEKFDPERFTEENVKDRHHYAHIPFGEGPRNCIGLRFGMMQTKVGLASLLRKYKFTVNSKTKEPLKMSTRSFVLAADGDVWLDAQKI